MKLDIIFDNIVPLKNICEASKQLFDNLILIISKEDFTIYAIKKNSTLMNLQLQFNTDICSKYDITEDEDIEQHYLCVETRNMFDAIRNIKKDISVNFKYNGGNNLRIINMKTKEIKKIAIEQLDIFEYRPIKLRDVKAINMTFKNFEDVCKESKPSKSNIKIKVKDKSLSFSTKNSQGYSYSSSYGKKSSNLLMKLELKNKDFFALGKLFKSSKLLHIYPPEEESDIKLLIFSFPVDIMAQGIFAIVDEEDGDEE